MLNPKHIHSLTRCLQQILGPHIPPTPPTQQIQQGQQQLSRLRSLPEYPTLLSYYINSIEQSQQYQQRPTNNYNSVYSNSNAILPSNNSNMSVNMNMNNNWKMFLLLQLKKIAPLNYEAVWWHLLEFYYRCNEKLERIVVDIVTRHFCGTVYTNAYQGFISGVDLTGQIPLLKLSKLLHIISSILSEISSNPYQQSHPHLTYLLSFLEKLLTQKQECLPSASINLIISKILHIIMLIHQIGQQQNFYHFFMHYYMLIDDVIVRRATGILFYCASIVIRAIRGEVGDGVGGVLGRMLRARGKSGEADVQMFHVLTYFLVCVPSNGHLIKEHRQQIIQVYYSYIMDLQTKKPIDQILSDPQLTIQPQLLTKPQPQNKYSLLTHILIPFHTNPVLQTQQQKQVISNNNNKTQNTALQSQLQLQLQLQLKLVPCLAYCNFIELPLEYEILSQRILIYFKSVLHYSTSQHISLLLSCFRFVYRFVVTRVGNKSGGGIVGVCRLFLDMRAHFCQFSLYCDLILLRAAEMLVTTLDICQFDQLWEFVRGWVNNYLNNYMSVTAEAYYPILIILDSMPQHCYKQQLTKKSSLPFPHLFTHIIELLLQQTTTNTNAKKQKNNTHIHISSFQIFYKFCSVLKNYLLWVQPTINQYQYQFQNKLVNVNQGIRCSQERRQMGRETVGKRECGKQQKEEWGTVSGVLELCTQYIFSHLLYSLDTAFIYVNHLKCKGDLDGVKLAVSNMANMQFWSQLQQEQTVFYSCILIGLITLFQHILSPHITENCQKLLGILPDQQKISQQTQQILYLLNKQQKSRNRNTSIDKQRIENQEKSQSAYLYP